MDNNKLLQYYLQYQRFFLCEDHDEIYKWEALMTFQKNWDIEADDFASIYEQSFSNASHLIRGNNYHPYDTMKIMSAAYPDQVRSMFKSLYNENEQLSKRIIDFIRSCSSLASNIDSVSTNNHYHDIRVISLYLFFKFPQKYYLYKHQVHLEFCEILNIEPLPKNESISNLFKYYELSRIILSILQEDKSFINSYKVKISNLGVFLDDNLHLLTQDFIWVVTNYFASNKPQFWAGGIYWGNQNMLSEFLSENKWEIGYEKNDVKGRRYYESLNTVKEKDIIALKSYGGQNDLVIHGIGEIIDASHATEGTLHVKWHSKPYLYEGKAPTGLGSGNWRTTLIPVNRERDIQLLFSPYGSETDKTSDKLSFLLKSNATSDLWSIEDKLNYDVYATAISYPIIYNITSPPLCIAIQAPWGQGKTSLMRMIQEKLEPNSILPKPQKVSATFKDLFSWLNKENLIEKENLTNAKGDEVKTVWFNPLYYHKSNQVWAGMAHAILHQLASKIPNELDREKFWLLLQHSRLNKDAIRNDFHKLVLENFLPYAIRISVALAVAVPIALYFALNPHFIFWGTTIPILGTIVSYLWTEFKKKDQILAGKFQSYVMQPDYKENLGFLHLVDHDVQKALRILVGNNKVAVFIDDLDRCSPAIIKEVILAINQFIGLANNNIIFFLGMDTQKVASALEKEGVQGPFQFEANYRKKGFGLHFMEKFIQIPFIIPRLAHNEASDYLKHLLNPENTYKEIEVTQIKNELEIFNSIEEVSLYIQANSENTIVKSQASYKVASLLTDPENHEIEKLVEVSIVDLDLNPRTMKRFLNLLRLLRNIQIVNSVNYNSEDFARLVVVRTCHLIINWPQIVTWLQSRASHFSIEGESILPGKELDNLIAISSNVKEWKDKINEIWGEEVATKLSQISFFQFMKNLSKTNPNLSELYESRLF